MNSSFSKNELKRYCKWAAHAVMHSVPLEEILCETRAQHGEDFAADVERKIEDFIH